MTVVIGWYEAEDDGIWLASDSRLSNPGSAGGAIVSTDRAAKILPLTSTLVEQVVGSVFRRVVGQTTFGLAYAGSTLVALQAHQMAVQLWANLLLLPGRPRPTTDDYASHLSYLMEQYGREVASASQDHSVANCECLLVGPASADQERAAHYISFRVDSGGIKTDLQRIDLTDGHPFIFGSGKERVQELCDAYDPVNYQEISRRRPLQVLRRILREDTGGPSVGGGVQIGFANSVGVQIFADVQPIEIGAAAAWMRLRGFELEGTIRTVGQAYVDVRALA